MQRKFKQITTIKENTGKTPDCNKNRNRYDCITENAHNRLTEAGELVAKEALENKNLN